MSKLQDQLQKIELHQAFSWDCPECGMEMFTRGIVPEMSYEEEQEMRSDFAVEPWENGDFILMPNIVECRNCHSKFSTVDDSEETQSE
jgi:hypothetical protein